MKTLALLILLLVFGFESQAQQTIAPEPTTHFYEIGIQDIGSWSDDATKKIVSNSMRAVFDGIPQMGDADKFHSTTSFVIKESSIDRILSEAGFTLVYFKHTTDLTVLNESK